jgi:hypothetical protein
LEVGVQVRSSQILALFQLQVAKVNPAR